MKYDLTLKLNPELRSGLIRGDMKAKYCTAFLATNGFDSDRPTEICSLSEMSLNGSYIKQAVFDRMLNTINISF